MATRKKSAPIDIVLPEMPTARPFRSRVIIDSVSPDIDHGRHAAKCGLGYAMPVEAIILCDSHESLKADVLWRAADETAWKRVPMAPLGNDRYVATITPGKLGKHVCTVEASIDRFFGWRDAFLKKLAAGEATETDLAAGLELIDPVDPAAAKALQKTWLVPEDARTVLDDPDLARLMRDLWDDPGFTALERELPFTVDPAYAVSSAWYEFFPRSRWTGIAEGGSLADMAGRLDYVADLGFDIVYLPPIHPIGLAFRKGRNNSLTPTEDDTGSPWAIGGKEGGHKAIHPALGTFDDFGRLIRDARARKLEVALDIAFQCSPDHPYVTEHPEWFRKRADGSIQYAENPPKKYQDIYPFDFETKDWQALWDELLSVILFWVEKGVRVFRVDNPHTKSFAFWEWAIDRVRGAHPEVIFLAEAFTRPHVMAYLAKIGFNQSYTYFAWRHERSELLKYMESLTQSELQFYFRPNFWPNTPDILTEYLQVGGRNSHVQRVIMAATLAASYGIYGPVYELLESAPFIHGKEEYKDSEKYQARDWDVKQPLSIAPLIKRLNRIRRAHPALRDNAGFSPHPIDNPQLLAFSKQSVDCTDTIVVIINLDRTNRQSGVLDLQLEALGIDPARAYDLHDLLSDARYTWFGWRNYVELDPHAIPAHIFHVTQTPAIPEPPESATDR